MMGLPGLPQPPKERTQYATGSAFWPGREEFVDFEVVISLSKRITGVSGRQYNEIEECMPLGTEVVIFPKQSVLDDDGS